MSPIKLETRPIRVKHRQYGKDRPIRDSSNQDSGKTRPIRDSTNQDSGRTRPYTSLDFLLFWTPF